MQNRDCLARRESDQMRCVGCRLVWDVNDPEPPTCVRRQYEAPQPVPVRGPVHVSPFVAHGYAPLGPFMSGLPEIKR